MGLVDGNERNARAVRRLGDQGDQDAHEQPVPDADTGALGDLGRARRDVGFVELVVGHGKAPRFGDGARGGTGADQDQQPVPDADADALGEPEPPETWGSWSAWSDTGNTRGTDEYGEKEQSRTRTSSRGRTQTQTRWVSNE